MRHFIIGLCSLCLMSAAAPASANSANSANGLPAWQAVVMPAAQQLDVSASNSGHRYRIFMSVPAGGYPVLYVLDGNAAFPWAAFLARGQAARSQVTGYVAPRVVGIGYPGGEDFDVPSRRRDYTVAAPGKLAARLQAMPGRQDKVIYHALAGEDHGPEWLPAMARGMEWFMRQPEVPGR